MIAQLIETFYKGIYVTARHFLDFAIATRQELNEKINS